ncbi:type II secretion system major pseudopilin GspG [Duganella qianjiadongensis]|uniref:Type II secretion system core protein G n=1 Tax=Duganella qianjiadongensis TaxID=2692176 RepID=A0ABW9VQF3_9BURK|nr:type II secretion system major pseudopilin GspG [Duganella qianjiadongensis]MYM41175.1 type II secretion system major pseudopilin GspG [Duganella qianjiadongensis]
MKQRGFTLLELLVVIVIIGLLAAFVAPKYFSQIGKSQSQIARAQIDSFDKALDQYRIDVGHYPTTEQGLAALNAAPTTEGLWRGPYLKKDIPLDPWGNAFVYRTPSTVPGRDYDLISYGKDGKVGGTGDDADITNN